MGFDVGFWYACLASLKDSELWATILKVVSHSVRLRAHIR